MTIIERDGLRFLHLADRTQLKRIAVEVNAALSSGEPGRAAASLDQMPELRELGVTDAVLGHTELKPVPWTVVPRDAEGTRVGIVEGCYYPEEGLHHELRERGARVDSFHKPQVLKASQDSLPRTLIVSPLTGTAEEEQHLFQRFTDGDTLLINPYTTGRNRKDLMAEAWAPHNIGAPETITRLDSLEKALAAYEQLGPDVVMKAAAGAHGNQVLAAHDMETVVSNYRHLNAGDRGILMQRQIDSGQRDARMHFSRDWETGLLLPVGGVERLNVADGFKTNLSGSEGAAAVRPIYDLTGGDPALPTEAIDTARRAGDALGYDAFAADIAIDRATGKPVMYEVDLASMVLDKHFPVPREHSVFKHVADAALFGDPAVHHSARGQSLLTPQDASALSAAA